MISDGVALFQMQLLMMASMFRLIFRLSDVRDLTNFSPPQKQQQG
jgi:hypothetical protein